MATSRSNQPELRKPAGSPRSKGRENAKGDTLCRNVLIYGHCRYEDQGCIFNHELNKTSPSQPDSTKKLRLEADTFTPQSLSPLVPSSTAPAAPSRATPSTIPIQAASAAPFTPQGSSSTTVAAPVQTSPQASRFNIMSAEEFIPGSQTFGATHALPSNGTSTDEQVNYDAFGMSTLNQAMPPQFNPYSATDASHGGAYYAQSGFPASGQLQHHLYVPMGPYKQNLLEYQRVAHDFFIPEDLRIHLQKRMDTTLQVMANSPLPNIEHFHSLVPLDLSSQPQSTIFGYPSFVYKATSGNDGLTYCLRKIEGYRLTNENAIAAWKRWQQVDNGGIVSVISVFTTRAFVQPSLIVATDYHALSKTLVEEHGLENLRGGTPIPENVLWSYTTQIASAIKAVHTLKLAVRCIHPSKVLVTDKNRVRLNGCAILDVLQFDVNRPLAELQQEDLINFGELLQKLGNHANVTPRGTSPLEQLRRTHTDPFYQNVKWLLDADTAEPKTIDEFLRRIAPQIISSFDYSLHANDSLNQSLSKELENGRLARLVMKLGVINDRPEHDVDPKWSVTGERYQLMLLRDYIFHQRDSEDRPVANLGHIVTCLNKLDAGTDEMVQLISRDEQSVMLLTYKELKQQINKAFNEVNGLGARGRY